MAELGPTPAGDIIAYTPKPDRSPDDLVERVAKAIYESTDDRVGWPWDRSVLGGKAYWLNVARAAIAALTSQSDADAQGIG